MTHAPNSLKQFKKNLTSFTQQPSGHFSVQYHAKGLFSQWTEETGDRTNNPLVRGRPKPQSPIPLHILSSMLVSQFSIYIPPINLFSYSHSENITDSTVRWHWRWHWPMCLNELISDNDFSRTMVISIIIPCADKWEKSSRIKRDYAGVKLVWWYLHQMLLDKTKWKDS